MRRPRETPRRARREPDGKLVGDRRSTVAEVSPGRAARSTARSQASQWLAERKPPAGGWPTEIPREGLAQGEQRSPRPAQRLPWAPQAPGVKRSRQTPRETFEGIRYVTVFEEGST
jgi:hypothetical protein